MSPTKMLLLGFIASMLTWTMAMACHFRGLGCDELIFEHCRLIKEGKTPSPFPKRVICFILGTPLPKMCSKVLKEVCDSNDAPDR